MNVTLSPKIQELIQEKVDSGTYAAPDDVVNLAFQLLVEHDRKLERLRALIDEGDRAVKEGRVRRWTPELRAELNRRADEMIARGEIPDSYD